MAARDIADDTTSDRPPFPFIVACPRSGTTLLRLMLDRHASLAIPPESQFLTTIWGWRRRYSCVRGFDLTRFVSDLSTLERFRDWHLDPALVRERLHGCQAIDFSEGVRRLYGLYAEVHGKSRYGDKTPQHALHMPFLAARFPESRFVHLVRDGRDVGPSIIDKLPLSGQRTMSDAAQYWRYVVRKAREQGRRLGSDRYLEIHYEDLVRDPATSLRAICRFIAVEFDAGMLTHQEEDLAKVPPGQRARHEHLSQPPTAGIRDWRRDFAPDEALRFEAIAGDELRAHGYQLSHATIPASTWMLARAHVFSWWVRRAISWAKWLIKDAVARVLLLRSDLRVAQARAADRHGA